jgi:hypothetical protein
MYIGFESWKQLLLKKYSEVRFQGDNLNTKATIRVNNMGCIKTVGRYDHSEMRAVIYD